MLAENKNGTAEINSTIPIRLTVFNVGIDTGFGGDELNAALTQIGCQRNPSRQQVEPHGWLHDQLLCLLPGFLNTGLKGAFSFNRMFVEQAIRFLPDLSKCIQADRLKKRLISHTDYPDSGVIGWKCTRTDFADRSNTETAKH